MNREMRTLLDRLIRCRGLETADLSRRERELMRELIQLGRADGETCRRTGTTLYHAIRGGGIGRPLKGGLGAAVVALAAVFALPGSATAQPIQAATTAPAASRGVFQWLYVRDGSRIRKLERQASPETAAGERTGVRFGPWQEAFCEPPGATRWTYPIGAWPRAIPAAEVRRLIGADAWRWLAENDRATVTTTFNLTTERFGIIGRRGTIPKPKPVKPGSLLYPPKR